jgi:uncharacterized protein YbbC (DUF1343 family)
MKHRYIKIITLLAAMANIFCNPVNSCAQARGNNEIKFIKSDRIITGAARTELYLPNLKGKSVGIICNQTSLVGKTHLIDTLSNSGIEIRAIFCPEHGFRGEAEAGAEVIDGKDGKTGIHIISLYGKKKKPLPEDLNGIDILLFDIQDVGARFYTYISTLALVMEAAAEQKIPMILTDRPNPNGFYIDGPVLDTTFRSFVGMHPVPVVYGMTIGEYALMVNGEGWLNDKKCNLTVIPLINYTHSMVVCLPVPPSPNLPTWQSVYLYPSLCFFEGTFISVGRGTKLPFQVIGHPDYKIGSFLFTPGAIPGVSEHPLYENKECTGSKLSGFAESYQKNEQHLSLAWLIGMHEYFKDSANFFNAYFDKLAGSDLLQKQIISGQSEEQIRKTWENDHTRFMQVREKYLLYPN